MAIPTRSLGICGLVAHLALGCTGQIHDPASTELPDREDAEIAVPTPPVRLTPDALSRSYEVLLGFPIEEADVDLGRATTLEHGFRGTAPVSVVEAETYFAAAGALAAAYVEREAPCATEGSACARGVLDTLAERAFRRPLTADERSRVESLYDSVVADGASVDDGIRVTLAAILQMPQFLYLYYLGAASDRAGPGLPLTGYEVASRLSYLLWRSPPDDALLAAAAANELRTPAEVAATVERMIDDPRADYGFRAFTEDWLGLLEPGQLTLDDTRYPEVSYAQQLSMRREPGLFFGAVLRSDDPTVSSLFSASFTIGDAELAALYDVAPPREEQGRLELDSATRSGLLTMPGFLAATSTPFEGHPIRRGVAVYRRILCTELPDPPLDVDMNTPASGPPTTLRERFPQHTLDGCAGCHGIINPTGFGFARYDALGRYLDTDEVDDSGTVVLADDVSDFEGVVELSRLVATSTDAQRCLLDHLYRYASGRLPQADDQRALASLARRLDESGGDLRDLLVALTTAPSFLRRPEPMRP